MDEQAPWAAPARGAEAIHGQDLAVLRNRMVMQQLAERGVQDTRVLRAMARLPRERFLPRDLRRLAYADCALPIAESQTISQPYMAATLAEALRLRGHERVLEVGTGSGYQAAVLALLCRHVVSIERHPALAERAAGLLRDLGFRNLDVVIGDGSRGWPTRAPYDAILVTAAAPAVPAALMEQLVEGGRLVLPIGSGAEQTLTRVTRAAGGGAARHEALMPCVFVPLIGAEGRQSPD